MYVFERNIVVVLVVDLNRGADDIMSCKQPSRLISFSIDNILTGQIDKKPKLNQEICTDKEHNKTTDTCVEYCQEELKSNFQKTRVKQEPTKDTNVLPTGAGGEGSGMENGSDNEYMPSDCDEDSLYRQESSSQTNCSRHLQSEPCTDTSFPSSEAEDLHDHSFKVGEIRNDVEMSHNTNVNHCDSNSGM